MKLLTASLKWIGMAFVISLLIIGCYLAIKKASEVPTFRIVVPATFRGPVFFEAGEPETVQIKFNNQIGVIVVPPSQFVRIAGRYPFFDPHVFEVQESDGELIPSQWNAGRGDVVAWWGSGTMERGRFSIFVGTKAEYDAFCREFPRFPTSWPPGRWKVEQSRP